MITNIWHDYFREHALTDDDLTKEADLALIGGTVTPQKLVETFMLGHDNGHLSNIKGALGM